MNQKRNLSNINLLEDSDDNDYNNENDMNELDSDIDSNENDEERMSPGIVWLEQQNLSDKQQSSSILYNVSHDDKGIQNNINSIIDEHIIEKYFVSAIQSHDNPIPTTKELDIGTKTNLHETNSSVTHNTLLNLWKPKELELPLWAVRKAQEI
jgi:hypothetical protein